MTTNVSRWTTALAVLVGGVLLATSAIAQSSAGSAPAASNPDTTKSDAPRADMTKSGAPKADMTKSGAPEKSLPSRDNAQGADREQMKAVQQALKDKGHDPGAVDGEMGPKTEAALREYQQKEGLTATGTADAETMAKLTAAVSTPAASPAGSSSGASKEQSTGAKTK
jgi:peptidoglycan hydrolase-like protein with peptidoglycan-binding domain